VREGESIREKDSIKIIFDRSKNFAKKHTGTVKPAPVDITTFGLSLSSIDNETKE